MSENWTSRRIVVLVTTRGNRSATKRAVDADCYGVFAVHKCIHEESLLTLTHISTGMRILDGSKPMIRKIVKEIYSQPDALSAFLNDDAGTIYDQIPNPILSWLKNCYRQRKYLRLQ